MHHEIELKDLFKNEMAKMKSAVFGTVLQEYYIYVVPQCLFNFLDVRLCLQARECVTLLTGYHLIVCHQGTMYVTC